MTKKKQLYLFAIFMVLYEFTTYAANDMIMPGMVKVITEFNVAASYIALSLIFYLLGNAILTPLVGPFSDRFGNRRVILGGVVLFTVATAFMIVTRNIHEFLVIRIFEGIGLSVIAAGYSLIHKNFNDANAIKITSLMANVAILAPLVGPMLGAILVSNYNWRSVFYLILVLAIIAFIGLLKYIPNTDLSAEVRSINSKAIWVEYKNILQSKNFIIGVIVLTLSAISFIEWIGLSPAILLYKMHKSYLEYTIYQLIAIGGVSLSSILMQFLGGKVSFSKILYTGFIFSILAMIINIVVFFVPHKLDFVSVGFFIFGFGSSLANSVVMRIIMTDESFAPNYIMSAVIFVQMILMMIVLEIFNHIIIMFDYSLDCLSLVNLIAWGFSCYFLLYFRRMNKNRKWQ